MVERNERKRLVLTLLIREGSVVTRDLVDRWNLSYSGAQALLEKYRNQSLVSREREPGPGPPVYRYFITRTGWRKAEWMALQGLRHLPGQSHLPGLEPPEELRIRPVLRGEPVQRIRPKLRD